MFGLFYGCYEYMTRREELHILLIGLDRAGEGWTGSPALPAPLVQPLGRRLAARGIHSPPGQQYPLPLAARPAAAATAGKTTLLERLKTLFSDFPGVEADKVLPTVGLNIARFQAYGSPLVFWDLGGQAGLRSIWEKYYGDAHAVLYVVDATDRGRLEEAKACLDRALGARGGAAACGAGGAWWVVGQARGGGKRRP